MFTYKVHRASSARRAQTRRHRAQCWVRERDSRPRVPNQAWCRKYKGRTGTNANQLYALHAIRYRSQQSAKLWGGRRYLERHRRALLVANKLILFKQKPGFGVCPQNEYFIWFFVICVANSVKIKLNFNSAGRLMRFGLNKLYTIVYL